MLSTEKVRAAVAEALAKVPELQAAASGMDAIMMAGVAQLAPWLGAQVLERLPEDPAELDELLDRLADGIAGLVSDPPADVNGHAQPEPSPGVRVVAGPGVTIVDSNSLR